MIWCLHGNIGMVSDWDVLSASGSPLRGQVIRKVDLWRYQECRAIGLKEFGEVFASEVAAQDKEPILVAYSMGARLALQALQAAPKLWKAAVLMSVHPGLEDDGQKVARRQKDAEWSAMALQSDWKGFLTAWNAQAVLGEPPEGLGDRRLLQPRSHAIARAFCSWSLGAQPDMRSALSEVEAPVKLMIGSLDTKYCALAESFVGECFSHYMVSDTGHRFLWENPEKTFQGLKGLV